MNEQVIEAAIDARDAIWEAWRALHQGGRASNQERWTVEQRAMCAAIRAADAARAPDVKAAVKKLIRASRSVGLDMEAKSHGYAPVAGFDREDDARNELYALLGIEDAE